MPFLSLAARAAVLPLLVLPLMAADESPAPAPKTAENLAPIPVPATEVAPVKPTPEQAARFAALREAAARTRYITIAATVYDHSKTFFRWTDQKSGQIFEGWSRIDFNHIAALNGLDGATKSRFFFVGMRNIDTAADPSAAPPAHPPIPEEGPGFVLVSGDTAAAEALAPLYALHDYYRTEKDRLAAEFAERERQRLLNTQ